jgi:hypothetical protein
MVVTRITIVTMSPPITGADMKLHIANKTLDAFSRLSRHSVRRSKNRESTENGIAYIWTR